MRRSIGMAAMMAVAMLAGCASPPAPDQVRLTAPPGLALPLPGRVLVQMSEPTLAARLVDNDPLSSGDGAPEGAALERAAVGVLGRAFRGVAVNRPDIDPQVVTRITGSAKIRHPSGRVQVTCVVDAVKANGDTIGYFFNHYRSAPVMGLDAALPGIFGQCLKKPVEQLLASKQIRDLAAAGFPAPDRGAADAYLRSQGYVIAGP